VPLHSHKRRSARLLRCPKTPEWVSGFNRNGCPETPGIRKLHPAPISPKTPTQTKGTILAQLDFITHSFMDALWGIQNCLILPHRENHLIRNRRCTVVDLLRRARDKGSSLRQ
jgi:hypothetical protein